MDHLSPFSIAVTYSCYNSFMLVDYVVANHFSFEMQSAIHPASFTDSIITSQSPVSVGTISS